MEENRRKYDVEYVCVCVCVSTDGRMEQCARGCCGRVTGLMRNNRQKGTLKSACKIYNTCYRIIPYFRTNKINA